MSISALLNLVGAYTGTHEGLTIEEYVDNFERVAALGGWVDVQRIDIMKIKCVAEAKDFIKTDPEVGAAVTWGDFKLRMLKRFKTIESPVQLLQNFLECVQKPGESVQSYTTRLRAAGARTVRTTGNAGESVVRATVLREQMLAQFLKGLRGPVKRFVLAGAPTTFEAAVVKAVQEEQNEGLISSRHVGMAGVPPTSLDTHTPPPLMEHPPFPIQCQICTKIGHTALECWKLRKPEPAPAVSVPLQCQLCNRVGHEAGTCRVAPMRPSYGNPRRQVNPPQPKCQLCQAMGHTAQACRKPQDTTVPSRKTFECFRCGKPGHFSRQCTEVPQESPNGQVSNPEPRRSRQ